MYRDDVTSKPSWFACKPNAKGCPFPFRLYLPLEPVTSNWVTPFNYIYIFSVLSLNANLCLHMILTIIVKCLGFEKKRWVLLKTKTNAI